MDLTNAKVFVIREKYESITRENSEKFARDIISLGEENGDVVVIDFRGIEQISSMGIGALFSLISSLDRNGRKLYFKNAASTLKRIFRLSDVLKNVELID